MQLTAELIPHSEFHLGAWLLPVERPGWYYFWKKKNTNYISNDDFIESVDPPLRELVGFLHAQGIRTTPSCAGHYRTRQEYKKIFQALEADAQAIRSIGLLLKDIETGKCYSYKNKHYKLPWNENVFLEKIMTYQHKGVLGMRLGHKRSIKKQLLNLTIPGISLEQIQGIVLIHLEPSSPGENQEAWKNVTQAIKKVFYRFPVAQYV